MENDPVIEGLLHGHEPAGPQTFVVIVPPIKRADVKAALDFLGRHGVLFGLERAHRWQCACVHAPEEHTVNGCNILGCICTTRRV